MANVCRYKMIVKGEKDACYAFYEEQHHYYQDIDYEDGSDEKYELNFSGDCKWSVDYRSDSIQERSEMYDVEVMCNSCDVDGDSETARYVHYRSGIPVASEVPEELQFEGITNQENLTYTEGTANSQSEELRQNKFFTTENGNKFRIDDDRIYLNDVFSVPVLNEQVRVSKEEESETFVIMSALFDIDDDEAVIIKLQFSTDVSDMEKHEMLTFLDGDYQIYINSVTSSLGFLSILLGKSEKIHIGVKMIINSGTYYITASTSADSESSVATAVRILEEFLNSIIICENNEKIRITRLPNYVIHNISNIVLGHNADSDEDDDE